MSNDTASGKTLAALMNSIKPVGYYSSAGRTGTHQTKSDVDPRQIIWGVKTHSNGMIETTPLFNDLPAPANMRLGKKHNRKAFLFNFWPEPARYVREALPKIAKDSNKKEIAAYPKNIKETVKEYLPMVLVYLANRQRAKAETIMDFMVAYQVPMCERQKKLLNRIAVELRREKKFEAALECLISVRKYYGEDENLHFNIARTMWDMKKLDKCETHLVRCLTINPDLTVAKQFLAQLRKITRKKQASTVQAQPKSKASAWNTTFG